MKFLAFGPLYFHSRRNLFDLFLALAIVLYSIFVIIFFNTKRPSVSVCVISQLYYDSSLNSYLMLH